MKNILILFFCIFNIGAYAQSWVWAKNFDYFARDIGKSVGSDMYGNCYVTGSSDCPCGPSGSSTGYYSTLRKFDNLGSLLWVDTLDLMGKAVTDTNGYTYIASGKIAKYNSAGLREWEINATMGMGIAYQNITLHSMGGIVVVGNVLISGETKGVLSRYDENGICLWTKIGEFPPGGSTSSALTCDKDGNSYVAGDGYTDSISGNFGFLVKYDNSGVLLSTRTIPHTPNDIATDNNNNIYVTGWFAIYPININGIIYSSNYPTNPQPQYLIKYDQAGNVLWHKMITGQIGRDAIATDNKGNVFLTIGYSDLTIDSFTFTTAGILVMKADSTGNILWFENSSAISSGAAYPNDIIANSSDEIFITGAINGTHTFGPYTLTQPSLYTDLLIAKIGSDITTNISTISFSSSEAKEFNVFPNPTNGVFQLVYTGLVTEQLQIHIFNSSGFEVYAEIITRPQPIFTKSINLSKEAKGTYYIQIIAAGKKSVEKIILN